MSVDVFGYQGKRAVVTGAASGMGAAVVELLVGLGADVHAVDRQPVTAAGVAASYETDLADPGAVDDMVARLPGPVQALFNCAGIPGTADPLTVLTVNFCGTRRFTEGVIGLMESGSAICSVASTSAVAWQQHLPLVMELVTTEDFEAARAWCDKHLSDVGYPYDFSKEAVIAYTAWRAIALNEVGVRINCINPGGTKTPASPDFHKVMRAKEHGLEMLKKYPRLMGRLADPSEQAWPMIFLNSGLASYVTGTSLYVDAGMTGGLFTGQHDPVVARAMRWTPPA